MKTKEHGEQPIGREEALDEVRSWRVKELAKLAKSQGYDDGELSGRRLNAEGWKNLEAISNVYEQRLAEIDLRWPLPTPRPPTLGSLLHAYKLRQGKRPGDTSERSRAAKEAALPIFQREVKPYGELLRRIRKKCRDLGIIDTKAEDLTAAAIEGPLLDYLVCEKELSEPDALALTLQELANVLNESTRARQLTESGRQSDKKSDNPKKLRKLTDDGKRVCEFIKRLKKSGDFETKKKAIRDWISKQADPGAYSYSSMDRELSDNPGYWR